MRSNGEVHIPDKTLQHYLIDQINKYLGPLNDFHHGLNPTKVEWMDLKEFPFVRGDILVLTTQLEEELELKYGTILENNI